MSRNYEVNVKIKGIDEKVIENYFGENFGSSFEFFMEDEENGILEGTTDICLCGGMMDYDAHEKISNYFKSINPKALVQTQWIDLENLPFEEYGDDFEDE